MIDRIKEFFAGLFGAASGLVMIVLMLSLSVGTLYWFWMAIQLGSFTMFLVLIFPPFLIVAGPIGIYSLIFGVPDWIINIFG
tara:strand:- start:5999 stop:6244 length:246 start_codon:yes stop_codon:yes gene_type:complete